MEALRTQSNDVGSATIAMVYDTMGSEVRKPQEKLSVRDKEDKL